MPELQYQIPRCYVCSAPVISRWEWIAVAGVAYRVHRGRCADIWRKQNQRKAKTNEAA